MRRRAIAAVSILRSVAIEFEVWRSGRMGMSNGSRTAGNRRFFAVPGKGKSRGGNRLPFGDQESVGCDA